MPHGTYNFTYYKPGFKQNYQKGFTLYSDKNEAYLSMSRAPSNYVEATNIYFHNGNYIRASITLNQPVPAGKEFTIATFLSNKPTVSDTGYLVKSINGRTSTGEKTFELLPSISVESLMQHYGFKSGDTAYLTFYTGGGYTCGYWEDSKYFWGPGLNTSDTSIYSITIP